MSKQGIQDKEPHYLRPRSSIFENYSRCYCDLGNRFYDLFKHDLKNYHNAILMSLDLYKLKHEEKYLDMISEASYKSLEHLERLKEIEPHIFNGGGLGFYSCASVIQAAAEKCSFDALEIIGTDCYVFADVSFSSVFELLFINILRVEPASSPLTFTLTPFEEDGFPKCRIETTIPGFSIPKSLIDSILDNDSQNVTSDPIHLTLYVSKKIINRYSGDMHLKSYSEEQTVFEMILYQESDKLKNDGN